MPLAWRAPVRDGDRVLVLGATGAAGQIAIQAAKLLGAAHVTAVGRDPDRLEQARELGADEVVHLDGDFGEPTYVFDPLCGEPLGAPSLRRQRGEDRAARPVRGSSATLTSAALRGKQLEVYGFSTFAVPADELAAQYGTSSRTPSRAGSGGDVERPLDGGRRLGEPRRARRRVLASLESREREAARDLRTRTRPSTDAVKRPR